MKSENIIDNFLDKGNKYVIIGVSRDKKKYGRVVYDNLKSQGYEVLGINPNVDFIDGEKIYNNLSELKDIDVVVFVVPPKIVERYLKECIALDIEKIWLQPGSESVEIINFCKQNGIACLHDQCIMLSKQ